MKLVNCSICGELFRSRDGEICDNCSTEKEDSPYKKVRDYISSHHRVSLVEVTQATGVDGRIVLKYIRDNKVSLVKGELD
ncbi:hypothetical protein [Alkaliphilus peptidifermentans]|uniref:FmdE-like treble clef zinc finger domain-containing protein n=1 Tax=Alkaliphilus peptidifermentans DSM 18978 TaxID=1120976 RepID=A0A1G5JFB0_9FIRM|nr:hypothetical protein [Alkaliphilus peptidifermentans]SCY86591.1 hypothetical protein SAMN03080606_02794 [Alkaliphilus peptidifermentans DSM 18978]